MSVLMPHNNRVKYFWRYNNEYPWILMHIFTYYQRTPLKICTKVFVYQPMSILKPHNNRVRYYWRYNQYNNQTHKILEEFGRFIIGFADS